MNIQAPFTLASVHPLGVWRLLGLRLRGVCQFQAFLASSPCAASTGSSVFCSPWPVRSLSFFALGLTLRSSRPAFCGRLILSVRRRQCHQSAAPPKFKAQSEGPFNERLCRSTQLGLEAGSGEREEEATGLPALQQSSSVLLGLRRRRLGISRNLDLQAQTALRL